MKILIVAYKFGTEQELGEHLGTYHYFIEIARRLVKAGHQVCVLAPWLSFSRRGSRGFDGLRVIRYFPPLWNKIWAFPLNRFLRLWYLRATAHQVLKFTKKEKPDAVFVWQARETGYAVAQIKDKLNCPFIFRQITTWHWHFIRQPQEIFGQRSWYQQLRKIGLAKLTDYLLNFLLAQKSQKKYAQAIYRQADKVIFLSQVAAREGLAMGLPESKVAILPVCIETDLFQPLDKKLALRQELRLEGNKIILFIGRINFAEKGLGYLLHAMPQIVAEVPDVNLVIVGGGGETPKMEALIKDLNIKNHVQLVGQQPFAKLAKYLNAADVFAMPSVWMEAFGQVTIEAMACGVPVVTSDAGASPEININNETGYVVPAENADALARALMEILKSDELRDRFGARARGRVLGNYTYEVVIENLLKIISLTK
ncbi:glycosyltransferase family 4 protein [Candidatus Kuenenbacteria bacterium]|nr:glycosyltransferase family 4 protein [Candidatus Kuenenbacteria bacterium]